MVSRREGESGEECAGGEWFSAGSLEVGDPEMVLAASDYDAVWRDFGDGSGFEFGAGLGLGLPKFDREGSVVFLQMAEGSRPGIESADLVGEFGCRSTPVDFAVAPGEFSGVGGALVVLGAERYVAFDVFWQSVDEELGAELGESVVQFASGFCGRDGGDFLRGDVSGVEGFVHFHDGDAGLRVAVENGPSKRRGAAVFGQKGGMHVEASKFGNFENFGGEHLAVGGGDKEIGGQVFQMFKQGCVCPQGGWLPDGQRVLEGFGFDRGGFEPQASALGFVRLADDSNQVHFGQVNQGLERTAG